MSRFRALLQLQPKSVARYLFTGQQGPHVSPVVDPQQLCVSGQMAIRGVANNGVGRSKKMEHIEEETNAGDLSSSSATSPKMDPDLFDSLLPLPKEGDFTMELKKWLQMSRAVKMSGKVFDLSRVIQSGHFPDTFEYCLDMRSPPHPRHQLLTLLLSEPEDNNWTEKALCKTISISKQLPMKSISDIVLLLSTSPSTAFRENIRRQLVTSVVSQRCYDIGPSHLVFFMYELDDLFDMKAMYRAKPHPGKMGNKDASSSASSSAKEEETVEELMSDSANPMTSIQGDKVDLKLDHRAISLVDQLKVKDLSRILTLLGKWRNRNETLINAILHRLDKVDLTAFTFIQLSNLLHACSLLSLHQPDILTQLCNALCNVASNNTPPVSRALACSILLSLSYLRWTDPALKGLGLDAIKEAGLDGLPEKMVAMLMTSLANLHSTNTPLDHRHDSLVKELLTYPMSSTEGLVNQAWCGAVLGQLSPDLASQCLQPDVVQCCLDSKSPLILQKLAAVSLVSQHELPEYPGPLLPEDTLAAFTPPEQKASGKMQTTLVKAFKKIVDLDTYVSLNVPRLGLPIDAMVAVDAEGKLCPLSEADKGDRTVRLACCQVVPFHGVLGPQNIPMGIYGLSARLLAHLGYLPVQIIYSDLRPNLTPLEHIKNIQSRITSAMEDHWKL